MTTYINIPVKVDNNIKLTFLSFSAIASIVIQGQTITNRGEGLESQTLSIEHCLVLKSIHCSTKLNTYIQSYHKYTFVSMNNIISLSYR